MLEHLLGLDHVVVAVRDLELAAKQWHSLGFTISPRGLHSAHLGTANHTIMFDDDYVELLGVVSETAFNEPTRVFAERGGGLERLALRTDDARAGALAAARTGLGVDGPIEFQRPVELGDGQSTSAAFRIFQWRADPSGGIPRIFAVEHLTPGAVWLPALMRHPNGVRRIVRVDLAAPSALNAAQALAAPLGATAEERGTGIWRVPMGGRGGHTEFLDAARFAERWADPPAQCVLVLGVEALATAEPYSEWSIDAGGTRYLCARVDGAVIAWEQERQPG